MEAVRQAEKAALPQFDRSLANMSLLCEICAFLLQEARPRMALIGKVPHAHLQVFVYADGFNPRGRGNVNAKVALVDGYEHLVPYVDTDVPWASAPLSWREMAKAEWDAWRS